MMPVNYVNIGTFSYFLSVFSLPFHTPFKCPQQDPIRYLSRSTTYSSYHALSTTYFLGMSRQISRGPPWSTHLYHPKIPNSPIQHNHPCNRPNQEPNHWKSCFRTESYAALAAAFATRRSTPCPRIYQQNAYLANHSANKESPHRLCPMYPAAHSHDSEDVNIEYQYMVLFWYSGSKRCRRVLCCDISIRLCGGAGNSSISNYTACLIDVGAGLILILAWYRHPKDFGVQLYSVWEGFLWFFQMCVSVSKSLAIVECERKTAGSMTLIYIFFGAFDWVVAAPWYPTLGDRYFREARQPTTCGGMTV